MIKKINDNNDKKYCVYTYLHNCQIYLLCVFAVNRDHQQCSLSLVVNSGTTDLASSLGTIRLVKQYNFTKITTTSLVKYMKIRDMIRFVISTCHTFHYIVSGGNSLFISSISIFRMHPVQGTHRWLFICLIMIARVCVMV